MLLWIGIAFPQPSNSHVEVLHNSVHGQPPKTAVFLLSVHPLHDQRLLYLHPVHMTDLFTYSPQAPAGDCSYQGGSEDWTPLLVSLVTNEPT